MPVVVVGGIVGWGWTANEPHAWNAERAQGLVIGDPHVVVPGPGMPAGLELAAANNNLDWTRHRDRVYLAGHSMGGGGTWHIAMKYPDIWAGLGPVAPSMACFPKWGWTVGPLARIFSRVPIGCGPAALSATSIR